MTASTQRRNIRRIGGLAICFAAMSCDSPKQIITDPSVAVALHFRTSPAAAGIAGSPFGAVVEVVDAAGQVVTSAAPMVTVTLVQTDGTSLNGTTAVSAADGVATFNDLRITKAWVSYTLTASSPGLQSATSASFSFYGGCSQLLFSTPPSGAKAGTTMPSFTVRCSDQYGNSPIPPGGGLTVTVALGQNPGGAALSGTLTKSGTGAGGVQFTDLVIDKAGAGYTLVATATAPSGLTAATSAQFTITP